MVKKRGFTLVELLVVIAIIGVLVALLLPAVQAAREAARRTDCRNRMRQVALACLMHHDARGRFPSASAVTSGTNTMMSYIAQVLPYMEHKNLHNLVDQKKHWSAPENDVAESTPLPAFRCPSQEELEITYNAGIGLETAEELSNLRVHYHGNMGASFYKGCGQIGLSTPYPEKQYSTKGGCASGGGSAVNGVIIVPPDQPDPQTSPATVPASANIRIKDVSDGTANTILVGEVSWDCGPQRVWIVGAASPTTHYSFIYSAKNLQYPFNTAYREAQGQPISPFIDVNNNISYGSNHPGGAHLAMCDGSVHFVQGDVDLRGVLQPMASRALEEVFTPPF